MKPLPKGLLVVVTAGTVIFFLAGMPLVSDVAGWFYRPVDRPIHAVALAVVFGAVVPPVLVVVVRLARRGRHGWAMTLAVVCAWCAQLAFSFVGGPGLDEVWRRHVEGHGELLRVAHDRRGAMLETLRDYDRLAAEGELGSFARSKPPGALLVYGMMEAVAEAPPVAVFLEPLAADARRNPRLAPVARTAALSLLLMPLLTALVLPALLLLSRKLLRERAAGHGAAILFMTCPAVLLISYHLDGALYPLVSVGACALLAAGTRDDRYVLSVLAGAVLSVGLYVTFSLLPAVPLSVGALLLVAVDRVHREPTQAVWQRAGFHLAAAAAGFVAVLFVLVSPLGYEPLARFEAAMQHHALWKAAVPTGTWRAMALVEFSLYAGVPLMAAFLWRVGAGALRMTRRSPSPADPFAFGLLALLLVLSAVAGTNEAARMWMFLLPFVALATASDLGGTATEEGTWWRPLAWLAGAQALLALAMKTSQVW